MPGDLFKIKKTLEKRIVRLKKVRKYSEEVNDNTNRLLLEVQRDELERQLTQVCAKIIKQFNKDPFALTQVSETLHVITQLSAKLDTALSKAPQEKQYSNISLKQASEVLGEAKKTLEIAISPKAEARERVQAIQCLNAYIDQCYQSLKIVLQDKQASPGLKKAIKQYAAKYTEQMKAIKSQAQQSKEDVASSKQRSQLTSTRSL